jgi:hypothetical protein|tara:strand:- start:181 stop:486 length:306 start_codon:yes stop_codon:yes gene_type:complete
MPTSSFDGTRQSHDGIGSATCLKKTHPTEEQKYVQYLHFCTSICTTQANTQSTWQTNKTKQTKHTKQTPLPNVLARNTRAARRNSSMLPVTNVRDRASDKA